MPDFTSAPYFEELTVSIKAKVEVLYPLYRQWADLARLAIQGLPYDVQLLTNIQVRINALRAELRRDILVASEHYSPDLLDIIRRETGLSKYSWRMLKKKRAVTLKHGFTLVQ